MPQYEYTMNIAAPDIQWLWGKITSDVSADLISITYENVFTFTFANDLLDADLAIVQHLVNTCPSVSLVDRKLTKLAFRSRFTFTERMALDTSTVPEVIVLRNDLSVAEYVDLDYPDINFGLSLLVTKNIITPERKAEILA